MPTKLNTETLRRRDADFARELGVRFVSPDQERIRTLQAKLATAANFLGVKPPTLTVPDHGFLDKPLTQRQRDIVAQEFDGPFGQYFTSLQDGVRDTVIVESGERMVSLQEALAEKDVTATFSDIPITAAASEGWAGKPRVYWAREEIAKRFVRLAQAYNAIGLAVHVEDGFRPEGVQEGLFQSVMNIFRASHNKAGENVDEETLRAEARSMVAISPWLAGHKSGAAIDYTLRTTDGTELDLGHKYLSLGAFVALDCPYVTQEQWETRQLFRQVAEMAGFLVYPGEDWHVSEGDVLASITAKEHTTYPTTYGPIKGFNQETGEIIPYDPSEYYTNFSYH